MAGESRRVKGIRELAQRERVEQDARDAEAVLDGLLIKPSEAERLTQRIAVGLTTLADTYESVMPLIREAIERRAYEALGYPSMGAYVSARFGKALARLGVETRREVVRELTDAGMSTRAIAPIIGVDQKTVSRDQRSGEAHASPDAIIGLDGKEYSRPAPRERKTHCEINEGIAERKLNEIQTRVEDFEIYEDLTPSQKDRMRDLSRRLAACADK
jgi:transposase